MPRSEILASTAESRTAFHPMEIQIFYIWDYGRVVIGVIVFPFRARQRLIVNGLVMTGVVVSGQGGIIPHFASARTRGNGQLNENKQISTILVSAITWIWALLPEAPEITCGFRRWRQVTDAAGTGCTGKAPVHLLSAVPWQLVYRVRIVPERNCPVESRSRRWLLEQFFSGHRPRTVWPPILGISTETERAVSDIISLSLAIKRLTSRSRRKSH